MRRRTTIIGPDGNGTAERMPYPTLISPFGERCHVSDRERTTTIIDFLPEGAYYWNINFRPSSPTNYSFAYLSKKSPILSAPSSASSEVHKQDSLTAFLPPKPSPGVTHTALFCNKSSAKVSPLNPTST